MPRQQEDVTAALEHLGLRVEITRAAIDGALLVEIDTAGAPENADGEPALRLYLNDACLHEGVPYEGGMGAVGVHFAWEDGAEVQRDDCAEVYEGDMPAALALARETEWKWLVYCEPHDGERWSVHAFRERWGERSAGAFAQEILREGGYAFIINGEQPRALQDGPGGVGYRPVLNPNGTSPRMEDECVGADGEWLKFGRCDTCGAPCDDAGCTTDREHEVAIP